MANVTKAGRHEGDAVAVTRRKAHARLMYRLNMTVTVIMMVAAVVLMSWPWVMQQITASGMLNEVTRAESTVGSLPAKAKREYLAQARAYDAMIARDAGVGTPDVPDVGQVWRYERQLTYQHDPMMSWVDVPSIGVSLPIYHGTTEDTLMNGVGHLKGTSLPVGGTSTHCVLTAHSGMAGATMFDDIRMLHAGDLVLLHTMDETLAYKVTGSEVVLPDEMDSLRVEEGKDLLTLVTCTPYGVNDHRLLVHCERTDYDKDAADAARSPLRRHYGVRDVAFFVAIGVTSVVLAAFAVRRTVRRHRRRKVNSADAAMHESPANGRVGVMASVCESDDAARTAVRRSESVNGWRIGQDAIGHADTPSLGAQTPHRRRWDDKRNGRERRG